jgi:hypothetical protein
MRLPYIWLTTQFNGLYRDVKRPEIRLKSLQILLAKIMETSMQILFLQERTMSHSPASRLGLARLKKDLKVLEQQPRFSATESHRC